MSESDAIRCKVTYLPHMHIGGGDPYMTEERSFEGRYANGSVYTRRGDGWEHCFSVKGAPVLGTTPLKRYMTNHGTYACNQGGSPVLIERI